MALSKPKIYIIEGCIGSGKSTFIESTLAHSDAIFGPGAELVIVRESIYAPFLDMYLKDQARMAFPFQICMARDRIEAMRVAQRHCRKGRIVLVDRGIPGDIAFAKLHEKRGNIDAKQMGVYYGLLGHGVPDFIPASLVPKVSCSAVLQTTNFEASSDDEDLYLLSGEAPKPIIVHLRVDAQLAFKRMQMRGISGEVENYTVDYFRDLCEVYEETIAAFAQELPPGSVRSVRYNTERRIDQDGVMLEADCLHIWSEILK